MNNNNYECKRCLYTCRQYGDMKKHLNKKTKCIRNLKSFNIKNEDLYDLSLIKKIKDKIYKCDICNKVFTKTFNLSRHKKMVDCKYKELNIPDTNTDNIPDNIPDTDTDTDTNTDIKNNLIIDKSIDNSVNKIDNSTTNNIIYNINLVNSFDDKWSTTHINDGKKIMLLLAKNKFTKTLENILDNVKNLNVLIDDTSDNSILFNNSKIENIKTKEFVKKTMCKLLDQLKIFENDINLLNLDMDTSIDTSIFKDNMKVANNKYVNFTQDKNIQENINLYIKDIYNKKKEETLTNFNNIQIDDDDKSGF